MNLPRSGRDTGPVLHDGFYKLAATVTRRSLKPKVTCQPTTDGSGTATIWAFCHLRQILFKVVLAICSIFLGVGTSLYISIWSCPESFRKSHPQKKSVVIEETYIMLMTTQGYFTLATCRISYQYCTIQSSTPPLGEFQSATSRPEPSLRQKAGAQSHGNLNESTPSAFLFSQSDRKNRCWRDILQCPRSIYVLQIFVLSCKLVGFCWSWAGKDESTGFCISWWLQPSNRDAPSQPLSSEDTPSQQDANGHQHQQRHHYRYAEKEE